MAPRTKAYLKLFIGGFILLGKLASPGPIFWPLTNAEALGYNLGSLAFIGLGVWLIVSGVRGLGKNPQ